MDDRNRNVNHTMDSRRETRGREQATQGHARLVSENLAGYARIWHPILNAQAMFLAALANGLMLAGAIEETQRAEQQQADTRREDEHGSQRG